MPVTCAILPRGSDENLDHDVVEVITKPAVEVDTNLGGREEAWEWIGISIR